MDDYNIIRSRLSRKITREGTTLEVLIYRVEGDEAWTLEVIDHEGGSTVWDATFVTEQDALNEVFQTIASGGISGFVRDHIQRLH
jgi:hypothetical protein